MEFDQFDGADTVPILSAVRMMGDEVAPDEVGLVELAFSEFTVFVRIDPEYDSLLCSRTPPESWRSQYCRQITSSFWDALIGRALTDAWQMTNYRGYFDALELQFREQPNSGAHNLVRLYGEGSQITLSELSVVRRFSAVGPNA